MFIGIDYHKAYSVYNVLDVQGESLGQGRIDHAHPEDFRGLVRRWSGCRVVFEAGMNWHWLFEILERELSSERIVLANPFKTRIIAEAQIKTDKVDARILADLLRGNPPKQTAPRALSERSSLVTPALKPSPIACLSTSRRPPWKLDSVSRWQDLGLLILPCFSTSLLWAGSTLT